MKPLYVVQKGLPVTGPIFLATEVGQRAKLPTRVYTQIWGMRSSPSSKMVWDVAYPELSMGMPLPSLHLPSPTQPPSHGTQQQQEKLSQHPERGDLLDAGGGKVQKQADHVAVVPGVSEGSSTPGLRVTKPTNSLLAKLL